MKVDDFSGTVSIFVTLLKLKAGVDRHRMGEVELNIIYCNLSGNFPVDNVGVW